MGAFFFFKWKTSMHKEACQIKINFYFSAAVQNKMRENSSDTENSLKLVIFYISHTSKEEMFSQDILKEELRF